MKTCLLCGYSSNRKKGTVLGDLEWWVHDYLVCAFRPRPPLELDSFAPTITFSCGCTYQQFYARRKGTTNWYAEDDNFNACHAHEQELAKPGNGLAVVQGDQVKASETLFPEGFR